jgi:hypothetical protein
MNIESAGGRDLIGIAIARGHVDAQQLFVRLGCVKL